MLVKTKKHEMWEIWSESAADSVFIYSETKPTEADVNQIWKEEWPDTNTRPQVFRLDPYYKNV